MKKLELDDELVIAQYYAFRSAGEVAKIYGCSDQTIFRLLHKNGINPTGWKVQKHEPSYTVKPIDDQEREYIISEYLRGQNIKDICAVARHSYKTVSKILKEADIPIRSQRKITDDQILEEIENGLTRQEIADKYGLHVERLAFYMSRLGVHARYAPNPGCQPKDFADTWHDIEGGREFIDRRTDGRFEFVAYRRRLYRIRCKTCGAIFERWRNSIAYDKTRCDICAEKEKEYKALQEERIKLIRSFYAIKELKTPKTCAICGKAFYSQYANQKYCSVACKRKWKRGGSSIRRRCRKYGVYYDPSVKADDVFTRDGYVCRICGKPCDVNDKSWGTSGAMAPTVDHIIPLAKGGAHIWSNVQCAHAICNSYKRDIV